MIASGRTYLRLRVFGAGGAEAEFAEVGARAGGDGVEAGFGGLEVVRHGSQRGVDDVGRTDHGGRGGGLRFQVLMSCCFDGRMELDVEYNMGDCEIQPVGFLNKTRRGHLLGAVIDMPGSCPPCGVSRSSFPACKYSSRFLPISQCYLD